LTEAGVVWREEMKRLAKIAPAGDGPIIDLPHEHIRLKASWNVWERKGRVTSLTLAELTDLAVPELLKKCVTDV